MKDSLIAIKPYNHSCLYLLRYILVFIVDGCPIGDGQSGPARSGAILIAGLPYTARCSNRILVERLGSARGDGRKSYEAYQAIVLRTLLRNEHGEKNVSRSIEHNTQTLLNSFHTTHVHSHTLCASLALPTCVHLKMWVKFIMALLLHNIHLS